MDAGAEGAEWGAGAEWAADALVGRWVTGVIGSLLLVGKAEDEVARPGTVTDGPTAVVVAAAVLAALVGEALVGEAWVAFPHAARTTAAIP